MDCRRGYIKGCFDHIKHDHIISTLLQWQVPTPITHIIRGFLKADIMEESRTTPSVEGTPQDGIISPMLANVALTCLDEEILSKYGKRYLTKSPQNPIVRYADDFVARNEVEANSIKEHIKGFLMEKVGLTLSDEKTRISEISNGFNFLGFNFRKYGKKDKLLIMPTKESIKQVKRKLSDAFRRLRDSEPDILIRNLIPITTGWSNYYRHVVSKQIFSAIDTHLWTLTKQWIKKRHPRQGTGFWTQRYFTRARGNRWILYDYKTNTILPKTNWTRIKRFIKVKWDMRVYDGNTTEYWEKRDYLNAKDSIMGLGSLRKSFLEQKGRCAYCNKPITQEHVMEHAIHTHHLKPRTQGGGIESRNLRLIHSDCHNQLHGTFSRQEMADLINKGIDYLRLMKPAMR